MKKLILPLFAALALTACGNNMDGEDGSDANDSMENSIQSTGAELGNDIDNATDSMDLHNDKNEMDGRDTLRN